MVMLILAAIALLICNTDTYAMGYVSYAGKSNPYAEYPVKNEPTDDYQPMVVRRPEPAILLVPEQMPRPQQRLISLQMQLQQAQQDLNIAQQNNLIEASKKIQENINKLNKQITGLQKQVFGR